MTNVILFDLDGTLIDTAHDLGRALNLQRRRYNKPDLPHEEIRAVASHGSSALLQLGFGLSPEDDDFQAMQTEYLAIYEQVLAYQPVLFEGMAELLSLIEAQGRQWGVVTNKPRRFTVPVMQAAQLAQRAACIVCGDDADHPKPYPDTLLLACALLQKQAQDCVYVGDAQRDVEAGIAAGMRTVVALYGYLDKTDQPQAWGADFMVKQPTEIMTLF